MSSEKQKKEYFDLVAYVQNKRKPIGYAYKTDKGQIAIKADPMMDNMKLGQLLKKGLYVQKRKYNQKNQDHQSKNPKYKSAADEYGT